MPACLASLKVCSPSLLPKELGGESGTRTWVNLQWIAVMPSNPKRQKIKNSSHSQKNLGDSGVRAVSTSHPSFVTSSVCSYCADRDPSCAVQAVQGSTGCKKKYRRSRRYTRARHQQGNVEPRLVCAAVHCIHGVYPWGMHATPSAAAANSSAAARRSRPLPSLSSPPQPNA